VIRPSAHTVGAGGMRVTHTFGERVAEHHVPAEHAHDTNLADATANVSPAAPSVVESTSAVLPLFASM
jgi:hypothetical protein